MYTNEILEKLELFYEKAEKDVEFFNKLLKRDADINDMIFDDMMSCIFQFYLNHKKGFVDEVEFEDGMFEVNKFLNLFENTEIKKDYQARAVEYLLKKYSQITHN